MKSKDSLKSTIDFAYNQGMVILYKDGPNLYDIRGWNAKYRIHGQDMLYNGTIKDVHPDEDNDNTLVFILDGSTFLNSNVYCIKVTHDLRYTYEDESGIPYIDFLEISNKDHSVSFTILKCKAEKGKCVDNLNSIETLNCIEVYHYGELEIILPGDYIYIDSNMYSGYAKLLKDFDCIRLDVSRRWDSNIMSFTDNDDTIYNIKKTSGVELL